jgi:glycine/D-amino acid oxidase-like deaminating enzyme
LRDALSFTGAVSDTAIADCYYRVVDGDRLIWSGRSLAWSGSTQRQAKAIVSRMTQLFPRLGKIEAAHAWSGIVGNTVHRMPQIGEIAPGLWILSGFGGRGLATTAMAGQIVTRAVLEGDRTWELFSPFALVWTGGWYGRMAEQVSNWSRRMSESIGGRLARRREERQRTMAGKAQAQG